MAYRFHTVALLGLLASSIAFADTIYLKNGVRFDGVVIAVPGQDGVFKVTAGDRSMFYRESEIVRVEKNDRTGHLDREALLRRWQEKNEELTEETGLTADQRRLVRATMFELKSEEVSVRIAAREKLKSYQKSFDVFGYLVTLMPELSPLVAPHVLQTLAELDSLRSVPVLKEAAQANHHSLRATAIDLMGRMRLIDAKPLIARGLVDFEKDVQMSAAYALAQLGVREATPALIELLTFPDLPVAGAARKALETLWAAEVNEDRPTSVSEWTTLWESGRGGLSPVQLAGLEVLSPEAEELRRTYDANH